MTWIPVSTQLPPDGEVVEVIFDDFGTLPFECYIKDYRWYWAFDNSAVPTPTHWRKKQKQ